MSLIITPDGVLSVTGTANRITVSAGPTPVIDISAAYVGQSSITTLGTIATGIWSATTIATTKGGTGLTSYVSGDILYASASNVLSALAKGSDGQVLKLASGIPSWASVASGLTGTTGDLISFSGTNTASNISAVATGSILASAGTGTLPVWSASPTLTTSLTVPLVIGGTTTTSPLTFKTTTGVGTTNADMIFQVGNNGATEAMRILNNGNVGIGTNAPSKLLHIKSTTTSATIVVETTAGSGSIGSIQLATGGVTNQFSTNPSGDFTVDANGVASDIFTVFHSGAVNGTMALKTGRVGLGQSTPTAVLHIKAGTATASTAPLKFTSGTLLTTAEAGALEFLTDKFYGTITTGAARAEFTLNNAALTSGTFPVATTNGRLTDSGFTSSSLVSGTNTPSATNVTNITSSTPNPTTYIRVGNVVTVDGSITVTNTLAVASEVDVALPVASNFGAATDLNGVGTMDSTASVNIYINADATNDRARIFFTSAGVGQTSTIYYSFSYRVI